ncbi:hypothetical protein JW968_04715 [Candidatus Woesearchaeota archaeon]|nr:hypothetical protein [Candidatus Woesearchaeota archaeon]
MPKKGLLIILFCTLLCALFSASAQVIISPHASSGGEVRIEFTPIKDSIMQGEEALFSMSVYNPTAKEEDLDFYFVTDYIGKFSPMTDPVYFMTTGITLKPDETKEFILKLNSNGNISLGIHKLIIGLESSVTGEKSEILLNVRVFRESPKYDPNVTLSISSPGFIDTSKKFSVKISLKNNNALHMPNLLVELRSDLFSKESYIELGPDGQKTVEYTFDFEDVMPQKILVTASAFYLNKTVSEESILMEVLPFLPSFELRSESEKGIVSHSTVITVKNNGNIEKTEKVSYVTPGFRKIFTRTDPSSSIVEKNSVEAYEWELTLKPNETATLTVTTSYLIPAVVLVVLLLVFLFYFMMKDPVIVIKNAHEISRQGGAVSSVKVMIILKNRRNKPFEDVRVIDRVNELVSIELSESPGVVKPDKTYSHAKEGRIVEWKFDILDPYEERLLVYEIRPKLSIIGNIRLEPVLVKYRDGDKVLKSYSNPLSIES